jgi:hypothetical protein
MTPGIKEFIESEGLLSVCERLRGRFEAQPPAWLQWLYRPSDLTRLWAEFPLRLPLDDLRVHPFLCPVDPDDPDDVCPIDPDDPDDAWDIG